MQQPLLDRHFHIQDRKLVEEFCPPNFGGCAMHNMAARRPFVERSYMEALVDALTKGAPVTILTGPSGSGKSASAREAVYRVADHESKPSHIVWVSLGHNSETGVGGVIYRIGTALGFSEIASLQEDRKVERCLALLVGRRVLLVIDNFETHSAASGEEIMAFLLQLPQGCRALVTTTINTELPFAGCPRIRVGYFEPDSAREFIMLTSTLYDPTPILSTDIEVIERLYRCTGGAPRAILLLIAAMRSIPPKEVLEQVESLASFETSTDPNNSRKSSVVQSFHNHHAVVWKLLTAEARRLLVAATFFRNAATSDALGAASDLSYSELVAATDALVTSWLLDVRPQDGTYRYELHQSTLLFMRAQNASAGVTVEAQERIARLCTYFTQLLRANPEDAALVESDTPTILALYRWCSEHREEKALIDLAMAAYDILLSLGWYRERIELAHLATKAAIHQSDPGVAAHFVTVSASTETMLGNFEVAETELRHGLRLANTANDPLRSAYVRRCIAFNEYRQGKIQDAVDALMGLTQALETVVSTTTSAERLREAQHALIDVLALEGAIAYFTGDLEDARKTFTRMLITCETARWERAISYPLRDLAEIAMVVDHDDAHAESLLIRALGVAEQFRDYRQIGKIELSFLKLRLHQGRLANAQLHYQRAFDIFATAGLDNELAELKATFGAEQRGVFGSLFRFIRRFTATRTYYGTRPIGGE